MILAGDIGGTNTLLALFKLDGNVLLPIHEEKFDSQKLQSMEKTITDFLCKNSLFLDKNSIKAASFSLAGPIYGNTIPLVNLGITLEPNKIKDNLDFIPHIEFSNDLEALGYGLLGARSQDLLCLYPGNSNPKVLNKAILAPGTGLGEALIMNGQYVYPTEGGHTEFAPQSELEVSLWRYLKRKFGHVSYERILSGPGLVNIYTFLVQEATDNNNLGPIPTPKIISSKALAQTCPLSEKALEIFVSILGAEAGNLALKSLALGGVYLGGGIPPKIIPKLQEKTFLTSMHSKGRFATLMKEIPVYIIKNEKLPLYGAALLAAKKLGHSQVQIQ